MVECFWPVITYWSISVNKRHGIGQRVEKEGFHPIVIDLAMIWASATPPAHPLVTVNRLHWWCYTADQRDFRRITKKENTKNWQISAVWNQAKVGYFLVLEVSQRATGNLVATLSTRLFYPVYYSGLFNNRRRGVKKGWLEKKCPTCFVDFINCYQKFWFNLKSIASNFVKPWLAGAIMGEIRQSLIQEDPPRTLRCCYCFCTPHLLLHMYCNKIHLMPPRYLTIIAI